MRGEDKPKRATIHDVARAAGVSAATVSKVLRGVPSVRSDNAERVREAVRDLGYRADPLAAGLRNEQRRIIGAVVPDLESPFFGALVTGLERAAEDAGYAMIVASSRESEAREAELVARMDDWRVAGTVLVPVRSERGKGPAALERHEMTAVLVDRASADRRFDTVAADHHKASADVAEFLVGQGHRHILVHGATRISKAVRTRVDGFTERARALDPSIRIDTLLSAETGSPAADLAAYFDAHPGKRRPTAVFSLSQNSTLMALAELRRRAIAIPDEIALVGFDDADWMASTWPAITAVAQPVAAIAERAMRVLLARIEGGPAEFPVQHLEPCTLMVRQSAGPEQEPASRTVRRLRND